MKRRMFVLLAILTLITVTRVKAGPPFTVSSHNPTGNGRVISQNGTVSVTLNQAINTNSVTSGNFTLRGQQTGQYNGSFSFSGNTITFSQTKSFKAGELLTVNMGYNMLSSDNTPVKPFAWQMRAAVSGGAGTFVDSGQQLDFTPPITFPSEVALGDVNGDGYIDALVHGKYTGVCLNQGSSNLAQFNCNQTLNSGASGHGIELGDLDNDGDLDAFMVNWSNEPDTVWLNNGAGVFTNTGQSLGTSSGFDVALGDLNGDGYLDAFVGNDGQPNEIWLNNGAGTFSLKTQSQVINVVNQQVKLGDLNGDGYLDAFIVGGGAVSVWFNNGSADFTKSNQIFSDSASAISVDLGDVNNDGYLDGFVVQLGGPSMVWLNNGVGTFTLNQSLSIGQNGDVALGDLDGDGDLDAYIAADSKNPSTVWRNNNGTFVDSGQRLSNLSSSGAVAVKLGDLDNDGDLDAFTVGALQKAKIWLNQAYTCTPGGPTLCNANFEQGITHWQSSQPIYLDTGHAGNYALKFTQWLTAGQTPEWATIYQDVTVTGGQWYNFQTWYKYQNAGQAHVKVVWFSPSGYISEQNPVIGHDGNSNGWIFSSGTILAPINATRAQVAFLHGREIGLGTNWSGSTMWVDDISFLPRTCPANQVCNGDFSQGLAYWDGPENATLTTGRTGQGVEVAWDGANSDIVQIIPAMLSPYKTYRAKVWCLADVGELCQMNYLDSNSENGPPYEAQSINSVPGTGAWQLISGTVTLTKTERLDLWLYSQAANSKVIYDDVSVEEVPFCSMVTEISPTECQALESVFNATNGISWTNKTGWLVTTTPCSWYGVTCTAGRVTQLHLPNNNLAGTIPAALGNLTKLEILSLGYNPLIGTLPSELGNLTSLRGLYIEGPDLTGSIPDSFANLINLEQLSLRNNQLSGTIPSWLGNLKKLNNLTLDENQFSGSIPSQLGSLPLLQWLNLTQNQLTGSIPPELGNLSNLIGLYLPNNQLTGTIPPELGKLNKLGLLWLWRNNLTGTIPSELGNLTNLGGINLENNAFSGEVPVTFVNLTGLNPADTFLGYNALTTSNPAVKAFLDSKDADWAQTQTVPPTHVKAVAASSSSAQLTWTPISYTTHGGYYQVYRATTSGGPYTWVGQTSNKSANGYLVTGLEANTTYYFVVNSYTPAHDYQLNNLTSAYSAEAVLYDSFCGSVTQIPLAECQALQTFYNSTGGATNWLTKTHWLVTTTPCDWYGVTCFAGRVTEIKLVGNKLQGTLPSQLKDLPQLEKLNLEQNELTGVIPTELGSLSMLGELTLWNNKLTGPIPVSLAQLNVLTGLNLGANKLSGAVPSELGQLTNLTYLQIDGNLGLSGSLPISLTNLKKLTNFYHKDTNVCSPMYVPEFKTWWDAIPANQKSSDNVSCAAPELSVSIKTLTFTTVLTMPQTLNLSNKGSGTINWTANTVATWLRLSSYVGTAPSTVNISVITAGLSAGTYTSTITFSSNDYGGTQIVTVTLIVPDTSTPTPTPTASATPTATPTPTATATPTVASPTPTVTPPTPTPTGTVTLPDPTPGNPETMYEPNDSCAEAKGITTDGVTQLHTFGQDKDEDWVAFKTQAGEFYQIEAQVAPDSPADLTLELWGTCTGKTQDYPDGNFSAGVRWKYQAVANQLVYLKLKNEQGDVYGANVAYYLSVRQLSDTPEFGAVIIVAGRYEDGDPLQKNIHNVTNRVHQLFVDQGYNADEHIKYLATDKTLKGVDDFATQANLEAAITQWAVEPVRNRSLTLYLFDHGSPDKVYLDGPRQETVSPKQLDAWLTQLETAAPGVKVNVIIEACYSGSFISSNVTSVSKVGRVVIASTTAKTLAFASRRRAGAVFSDYLFDGMGQNETLNSAFQRAHWSTKELHPSQIPWLDDNGNGIPNERADGQVAMLRGLGVPGTFDSPWAPYIAQVAAPAQIVNETGLLQTVVYDKSRVEAVWALVYPPSYRPPTNQEELVDENELTLPSVVFQPKGNDKYEANYTKFDEVGVYRVVVLAKNEVNLEAQPKSMLIPVLHGGQLITPTEAVTLSYQGALTVHVPAAVFTATTVLSQTSLTTPSLAMPAGWYFAGQALRLEAYQYGQLVTHTLQFTTPITLTFNYREEDITNLDESTLELRYWNGQAWTTNGITRLSHNPEVNVIQFTLSHLSDFALFGQAKSTPKTGVYLPMIVK